VSAAHWWSLGLTVAGVALLIAAERLNWRGKAATARRALAAATLVWAGAGVGNFLTRDWAGVGLDALLVAVSTLAWHRTRPAAPTGEETRP
jgi:hypothetical protein